MTQITHASVVREGDVIRVSLSEQFGSTDPDVLPPLTASFAEKLGRLLIDQAHSLEIAISKQGRAA